MLQGVLPYLILQYIVNEELTTRIKEPVKLPPMDDLIRDLGISRGKLREELLAAQAYEKWKADRQGIKILDVRTLGEYVYVGHAPMAYHIPLRLLSDKWDTSTITPNLLAS